MRSKYIFLIFVLLTITFLVSILSQDKLIKDILFVIIFLPGSIILFLNGLNVLRKRSNLQLFDQPKWILAGGIFSSIFIGLTGRMSMAGIRENKKPTKLAGIFQIIMSGIGIILNS